MGGHACVERIRHQRPHFTCFLIFFHRSTDTHVVLMTLPPINATTTAICFHFGLHSHVYRHRVSCGNQRTKVVVLICSQNYANDCRYGDCCYFVILNRATAAAAPVIIIFPLWRLQCPVFDDSNEISNREYEHCAPFCAWNEDFSNCPITRKCKRLLRTICSFDSRWLFFEVHHRLRSKSKTLLNPLHARWWSEVLRTISFN